MKVGLKLDPDKLCEIRNQIIEYINSEVTDNDTEFNLMANSTLSGESIHFNDHDLRLDRVESLLNGGLLYADILWIKNPLDGYVNICAEDFTDFTKRNFLADLDILYSFRDSLHSGFVKICKTDTHFCRHCLMESLDKVPDRYTKNLKKVDDHLKTVFRKGADFNVSRNGEDCELIIKPKVEGLFTQSEYNIIYNGIPDAFSKALERANGKVYQKELKDSYLIRCDFANPILNDIVMHDWYSSHQRLNYFTDRSIDMELIQMLNGDELNITGNKLIKSLKHDFPFISNVPSEKVIELRNAEPEAFVNYRDSLDKLLRDSKNLNQEELNEAIRDEVKPHLNNIDLVIKKHKRKIGKGVLSNIFYALSSIVIGLKTGILPPQAGHALAALGAANHGTQTITNLINLFNQDNEIIDDKYYFLWKLKQ